MTPADAQQLAVVTLTVFAVSFVIGIGVYVWYSLMLAKVFAHFGLAPWSAWVPVYNQMQVFRLGGQNPWFALLLFVPIVQVVGLVFLVMALHRISGRYWRGIGTTVLGVLLPPVWATVLAVGPSPDPERGRMPVRGAATGAIPPVAPEGPLAAGAVATPAAWPSGDSAPILPAWTDLHPRGAEPAAAPIQAAPIQPAPIQPAPTGGTFQPAPPAAPAADPGAPFRPPVPAAQAAPLAEPAPRIPGRIEPLPAMPGAPAPAAPVTAAPPFAAPEATTAPITAPSPVSPPVLPSLPPFPAATSPFAAPRPSEIAADTAVMPDEPGDDELLDRTVVVTRRPQVTWRLVPDDAAPLPLLGQVVLLGRNPRAAGEGEQRLVVPDPSRTLSKTHAVLRLEGEQWSITDLGSTNGVLVPDETGVDRLLDSGEPTPVPDRFVLGTLSVRIERDPPLDGAPGR